MANSKRVVGKSKSYRSSPSPYPARSTLRFQTVASLSQSSSGEAAALWQPKFLAIFVLILIVGILFEFFNDDWFFINQLELQGLNFLTPNEIQRATGASGYNIFFIEPSAVERALKKIPEIKSAHVATGLPNTMLVQVEEREPLAIWVKGSRVYWVDDEGVAFDERAPRADLPTVRDQDLGELKPGKHVQSAALNALLALRLAWSDGPKNFEWSAATGLSTTDEHGWKILFGDATNMEFKVAKLQALLPNLVSQGTRIKLIDLGKGDPYYQ